MFLVLLTTNNFHLLQYVLHDWGCFFSLKRLQQGVFTKKLLGCKTYLRGNFWEIQGIQIQIYPQNSIEPKYGAFYLKNKVSVPLQSLLVQLSLRVTPPIRYLPSLLFQFLCTMCTASCRM